MMKRLLKLIAIILVMNEVLTPFSFALGDEADIFDLEENTVIENETTESDSSTDDTGGETGGEDSPSEDLQDENYQIEGEDTQDSSDDIQNDENISSNGEEVDTDDGSPIDTQNDENNNSEQQTGSDLINDTEGEVGSEVDSSEDPQDENYQIEGEDTQNSSDDIQNDESITSNGEEVDTDDESPIDSKNDENNDSEQLTGSDLINNTEGGEGSGEISLEQGIENEGNQSQDGIFDTLPDSLSEVIDKIRYFFKSEGDGRYIKYGKDKNNIGTITLKDPKTSFSITIMDKNLGANVVGIGNGSYGYYFQWGNNHGVESVNSTNKTAQKAVYNDNYYSHGYDGNGVFIVGSSDYWENGEHYNSLWGNGSKESSRYGACPAGYHVPTIKEWNQLLNIWGNIHTQDNSEGETTLRYSANYSARNIHTFKSAATQCTQGETECVDEDKISSIIAILSSELKLPLAGSYDENGNFHDGLGVYWTSISKNGNSAGVFNMGAYIGEREDNALFYKAQGHNIRCFQNVEPYVAPAISEPQNDSTGIETDNSEESPLLPGEIQDEVHNNKDPQNDEESTQDSYPENDIPSDVESYPIIQDTTGDSVNKEINTKEYTITWKNEDGSIRDTTTVAYGQMPTHADPIQSADAHYSYEFAGWEPELKAVEGDTEYKAKYIYIPIEYTITWKNEDGTIIDTSKVAYGQIPAHANPIQPSDEKYSYKFVGWEPKLSEVKGNTEYRAKYEYIVNKFTITRENEDGTVIDTTEVPYGEIPTHEDPIQPADEKYSYEFAGWEPEISEVTGSAEYRATYKYITNKYTVTWKDENETVLGTGEVEYGAIPTYDGELPTKESSEEFEYTFAGREPEIEEIKGDVVYKATYTESPIIQNEESNDGNEVQTGSLEEISQDNEQTTEDFQSESQNNENIASGTQGDENEGGGNTNEDSSINTSEGENSINEGENSEEEQGFFGGLWETLKSFFLDDEDGYLRGSETINDIIVSVEAEEGTFPAGTEVVIKGVSEDRLESIQTSLVEDKNNNVTENAQIVAFDISFVYSGEEIQPEKEVSVKFNYKDNSDFQGSSISDLSVYHIDDETDEGTEIQVANKNGDEIEILATDFSIYVLTLSDNNSITLTLNPGDGTIITGDNIVVNEQGIGTITSVDGNVTLPNVTRENHVFVGWYTSQTSSLQSFVGGGGDEYQINNDTTLYASWCNNGHIINTEKTSCISRGNLKTIMDQNPNFTWGEIEILKPNGWANNNDPDTIIIMDRNLGATASGTNNSAWGYYYQYGNNYGFTQNPPTIARNIADINLTKYEPGNPYYSGNFVIGKVGNTKYNDWPTTPNYNIWGYESGTEGDRQGPCPLGWHMPTIEEWNKVIDYRTGTNGGMNVNNFRTQLSLPLPGGIMRSDAKMEGANSNGWFRTVSLDLSKEFVYELEVTSTSYNGGYSENMVNARQIRCFKNEDKSDIRYTVIYKDGEDEEVFEDQIFSGLSLGDDFPEFSGNISSRIGENDNLYEFSGWYLSGSDIPFDISSAIVRHDTVLYAKWNETRRYTVIYTDGKDDMEIFEDQIYSGLLEGGDFPQFSGNIPSRTGENDRVHDFAGWYLSGSDISFDVSGAIVSDNVILYAKWTGCPDGEAENARGECVPTADKQRELQIVQDLDVYFLASDTDKKHYTLMDRNMGAAGVYNKNYGSPNPASLGYVYQWGNNYGFPARGDLAQQGVATTTSQVPKSIWSLGVPSKYSSMTYYLNSNKDASWMAGGSKSDGIWGGTGDTTSVEGANTTLEGRQGPCPAGYHVPSSVEIVTIFTNWSGVSVYTSWDGTGATSAAVIFSEDFLLPPAGRRAANGVVGMEVAMSYWSSSPHPTKGVERALGFYWNPTDDGLKRQNDDGRLRGRPVRCVKNTVNTSTTTIATQDIHLNGGENAVISIDNGVISSLRSPTRIDSTFEGWYTSSDFSGNALSVGNSIQAGSSLYAKFTCNETGYIWNGSGCEGGIRLYFDSMGGTEVPSQLIESGMTGTRPADPTKTGYVFSGWFLTGAIEEFDFTGTPITGETTVYAHWNTGEYEVSIASNNVDYGTVDSGSIIADYGTPISTNENELTIGFTTVIATPATSGEQYTYTFSGWTFENCGIEGAESVTTNCEITANFDRISNGYTVTWNNSDGTALEIDLNVPYGTMPSYDGEIPTSGGDAQYSYTFEGWSPAAGVVQGDITYTATYTQSINEYTVMIQPSDINSGTVTTGFITVPYGTNISKSGNILEIGNETSTANPNSQTWQYDFAFVDWADTCGTTVTTGCTITANFQSLLRTYTLDLVVGTGIEAIYYKINGASEFINTGITTLLSGIEAGSTIYAYAESKDGYTYTETSESNPRSVLVTGDNVFSPAATANENTDYTVYHYVKIAGQSGYALSKTDYLTGTTDKILILSSLAKESEFMCAHYSSGSLTGTENGPGEIIIETTIKGDGSTKIYLYYTRNNHRVILSGDEHVQYLKINGDVTNEAVWECGGEVPVDAVPKPGYHFVRWDREREEREDDENGNSLTGGL